MKSQLDATALAAADRAHFLGALAGFANQVPTQWCPPGHPAHLGQVPSWQKATNVTNAQFADAVAASAPNHCIDGWSYASRALAALLAGDGHATRHLAYYAQLRAGMSMLANLGVGIFNRTNFVLDSAGAVRRLDTHPASKPKQAGMGTHDVVWAALRAWAAGPQTSRQFLDLVKIRGVSLRDCLDAIWPGFAPTAAASSLVEAWGLDLKRGKDEHLYRNISSYTPQAMNPLPDTAPNGLEFVNHLWGLLEPTTGASFDNLDRFLLRSLLWKQHRTVHGNHSYGNGPIVTRYYQLPAAVASLVSSDFLIGALEPRNPELIRRALSATKPAPPLDMLARAMLLLRAATAFTHSSFQEAGLNCAGGDLRPWIDVLAETRGFWEQGSPLADPVDLWTDVQLARDDFQASLKPLPSSMGEWMKFTDKGLPTIFEVERVAVWSLCA